MKVFGFAGYSGSGKTTLIDRLIPLLMRRGLRVSVIKHAHHEFELDQPGKDSWRHRKAGAREVLVSSARRWALIHENEGEQEPSLAQQLGRFSECDLVLVEGYKTAAIAKLEVHRAVNGKPWLYCADANIAGIVTDQIPRTSLPVFGLDEHQGIAQFIVDHARKFELSGAGEILGKRTDD